jgi:tetratricopeptide (TPR) repeat protein
MFRYLFVICLIFLLTNLPGPAFCDQSKSVGEALQRQSQEYYQEGRRQVENGDLDSALANFQKAIALTPGFVRAYNEAGVIFTINGQNERAKEMYLRSIQMAPDYPESYSNLALLYEEEGDFANAALCWKSRANLGSGQDPWAEVARRRLQDIAQEYPETSLKVEDGEYQFSDPGKVDLFKTGETKKSGKSDSKMLALDYLARAKDFYSRGEYVGALKESTMAEYLDPANREISALVQEIRQAILK